MRDQFADIGLESRSADNVAGDDGIEQTEWRSIVFQYWILLINISKLLCNFDISKIEIRTWTIKFDQF